MFHSIYLYLHEIDTPYTGGSIYPYPLYPHNVRNQRPEHEHCNNAHTRLPVAVLPPARCSRVGLSAYDVLTVTESEGRSFTVNSERQRPQRRLLKEQRARVKTLDGVLLTIAKDHPTPEPTPEPVREVWLSWGYELARKVRADFEQTNGPDNGAAAYQRALTAAYQQACQRYVQENGKLFTPKVLRESLRRKDEEAKGYLRGGNLRGLRGR